MLLLFILTLLLSLLLFHLLHLLLCLLSHSFHLLTILLLGLFLCYSLPLALRMLRRRTNAWVETRRLCRELAENDIGVLEPWLERA